MFRRQPLSLLFFSAAVLVTTGCGGQHDAHRTSVVETLDENSPVQESWGMNLTASEAGMPSMNLQAGHGAEFRTANGFEQRFDKNIRIITYGPDRQVQAIISAKKAMVHDNQDIEAEGKVSIRVDGNTLITTEYAHRRAADQIIASDQFVTISRPTERIWGEGFSYNPVRRQYRLYRGAGSARVSP